MAPTLSVCILTYNRSSLLERAVKSVQELHDLGFDVEAIISDDASTDDTPVVAASLVERYPFVRYFRNSKNYNVFAHINLAMRKARGDYVVHLSDDDSLLSQEFLSIIRILESNPNISMVTAPWAKIDDRTGEETGLFGEEEFLDDPQALSIIHHNDFVKLFDLFVRGEYFPEVWIMRRSVVESMVGGLSDDTYTAHRFAAHGLKCGDIWMRRRPFYRLHTLAQDYSSDNSIGASIWHSDFEAKYRAGLEYIVYNINMVSSIQSHEIAEYKMKVEQCINNNLFNAVGFLFIHKKYEHAMRMLQRAFLWARIPSDIDNCRRFGKILIPAACAEKLVFLFQEGLDVRFFSLYNDCDDQFFASVANTILSSGKLERIGINEAVQAGVQERTAVLAQRSEFTPAILQAGFPRSHIFIPYDFLKEFRGLSDWL